MDNNVPTPVPDEIVTEELSDALEMTFSGPNGELATIRPPAGRPLGQVLHSRRLLARRMVDDLGWTRTDVE